MSVKPVIEAFTSPGDVVLDPFCGSQHAFGCQNLRPPVKVADGYSIPGAKSFEELWDGHFGPSGWAGDSYGSGH